ncbi:hypothetical protein [Inhella sp.]|uniref:hypothetical protein n=1 Tax=Inhella sp. TaxID=1921806 RepID=UPI0035ADC0AA
MGWGDSFKNAYAAASDSARQAAQQALASARGAAEAVAQQAQAAAQAAAQKAQALAAQGLAAAQQGLAAAQQGAQALAQGAANVASFAARAAAETVGAALTAPYKAARAVMSAVQTPAQTLAQACPNSVPAKIERLAQRNELIKSGQQSADAAQQAAAQRLAQNNPAVELARLSDNVYAQYPNNDFHYPDGSVPAPLGWSIVPPAELEAAGVDVKDLEAARAVLYRTPPDWPGGPQTVLAFRGTADLEDAIVDHDQAMALPTTQYKAAMKAGDAVAAGFGPDTQVTGHSLGGGKAQAAGVAGGLKGTMFNAAGLNPATVGDLQADPTAFSQYRSSADPLTGLQNSPALQAAVAVVGGALGAVAGGAAKAYDAAAKALGGSGLSPEMADYADKALKVLPRAAKNLVSNGDVMPPALGAIHEVTPLTPDGGSISSLNPMGQHSITNLVEGIEQQKAEDLATLTHP